MEARALDAGKGRDLACIDSHDLATVATLAGLGHDAARGAIKARAGSNAERSLAAWIGGELLCSRCAPEARFEAGDKDATSQ